MLQLPFARAYLLGPSLVLALSVTSWLFQSFSIEYLEYHRSAVIQGEWWRWLSANLVHSNLIHLLLNALGVFMLWALYGDEYKTQKYLFLLCIFGLSCTLGIHYLNPERTHYVGLSGALHGLFAWGIVQDIRRRYVTGWLLLAGLTAKIIHEQLVGGSAEMALLIEARVATEAHLYGVIAGLIVGCWNAILHPSSNAKAHHNDGEI